MPRNPKTSSIAKADSVHYQWDLLKQVVKDPSSISELMRTTLTEACQSQAGLAALEAPERQISGMSLNTHKAIAEACLEGGYEAINDMRKAALARLNAFKVQADKPTRGTLEWYRSELAVKTERLEIVTNEVALMSQRLDEVLALAAQMAKAAGKENEFNKRRGDLLRKFTKHE